MLVPIEVPTGPRVLELIPLLRAALAGTGPGLLPFGPGNPIPEPLDAPRSVALAVGTSGSTGAAKQVLLSAAALRHSAAAGQRRLYDGDPGTWLLTLPAHHIAGLNVLIRATLAGREPVVMDVADTFTAPLFVAATAALPVGPAFVSLVPTQLHRLLDDPDGAAALRRFTAVLVGGAATGPDLIDAALAAGVAIVTSYGMSETSGGCVYDGRPLDGVTATLQDGCIVLAGPVLAEGYSDPGMNAPFGVDPHTGLRSFRTGDLGQLGTDGTVTVLGRADDVLISGGVNVAPLAVEHALAGAPGVAQLAITGVPDAEWGTRLVAVVVPAAGGTPELATLRTLAIAAVGPAAAPRQLLLVDALPTRGPGKLDRDAVARFARQALDSDIRQTPDVPPSRGSRRAAPPGPPT